MGIIRYLVYVHTTTTFYFQAGELESAVLCYQRQIDDGEVAVMLVKEGYANLTDFERGRVYDSITLLHTGY